LSKLQTIIDAPEVSHLRASAGRSRLERILGLVKEQAILASVLRYVLGMADMPLMILPVRLEGEIPVEIGGAPAAGRLVVLSTETTRGRTAGGLRALGRRSLDGQPVAPPRSAPGFAGYRVEATQRRSPAAGG
jgi:hypothetical protein